MQSKTKLPVPKVLVTSYGIGEKYIYELNRLIRSIRKNSKTVDIFDGSAIYCGGSIEASLASPITGNVIFTEVSITHLSEIADNWNNLGFLKPFWIQATVRLAQQVYEKIDDLIIIWTDADSRVRGDLECIVEDLGDDDIGMIQHTHGNWLAGTIAFRVTPKTIDFIDKWAARCGQCFRDVHEDWRLNDQTVMRNLIADMNHIPGSNNIKIRNLGSKWSSLPPALQGSKENPAAVFPTDPDALIWHWQASRGSVKGWNWPPPEEERKK